jgi:hypothetical protein
MTLLILGLAAYFSIKSSKTKGLASISASSCLWSIYLILPIACMLVLLASIIMQHVASQRLLDRELPDATARSITKGLRKAVKESVASGIDGQWALLNQEAQVLDWKFAFEAIATDQANKTGLFNPSLAASCNMIEATTANQAEIVDLLPSPETQTMIDCIRDHSSLLPDLTRKKHDLFHSKSLVLAFNAAFSLSLPLTLHPESLYHLIEETAFSKGNATFINMANTVFLTVNNNIKLSYGPAWYFLILSFVAVFLLRPFVKGDWYQRLYYMNHHYADARPAPKDIGV